MNGSVQLVPSRARKTEHRNVVLEEMLLVVCYLWFDVDRFDFALDLLLVLSISI